MPIHCKLWYNGFTVRLDNVLPGIGASVGTPGEKNVLVCAIALPTRHMPAKILGVNMVASDNKLFK